MLDKMDFFVAKLAIFKRSKRTKIATKHLMESGEVAVFKYFYSLIQFWRQI